MRFPKVSDNHRPGGGRSVLFVEDDPTYRYALTKRMAEKGFEVTDVAHFQDNYDNRRVPSMNNDAEKTVASMERIADLVSKYRAQFWINHDAAQTARTRHAPEFYD